MPKPDLNLNTWNTPGYVFGVDDFVHSTPDTPYIWKSITIYDPTTINDYYLTPITIAPNPTNDNFTISFTIQKNSYIKITLKDISGIELMQIYDGYLTEDIFCKEVNIKNLPIGTYFVNVMINGNSYTEKIVKN